MDDYTFSELVLISGLEEEKLVRQIQLKDTRFSDEFEALAIAAYQVKIVGDIESIIETGYDGYYQKIRDNYQSYKNADNNEICKGYFSEQVFLWNRIKKMFEKEGLNLDIPEDHSGAGRYVQYPIKSHLLKNSELLGWADKFIKNGIKPHDVSITYAVFCSILLSQYNNNFESFKRTIFNFYKIWDGQTKAEIIKRKAPSKYLKDFTVVDSILVLELLDDRIVFYNKETGKEVKDINKLKQFFFSESNRVFFVQNEGQDLYSPKKNKIEADIEYIILSTNKLNIYEIDCLNYFSIHIEGTQVFVYILSSSDTCLKLGIEVEKLTVQILGGLKKDRITYYGFALPSIKISIPQKNMLITANNHSYIIRLDSNYISLATHPCLEKVRLYGGEIIIRLPDFIPIKLKVEMYSQSQELQFDKVGWITNANRYVPSVYELLQNQKSIIGFCSTINFDEIKINNSRTFLRHLEYLEKRSKYERTLT